MKTKQALASVRPDGAGIVGVATSAVGVGRSTSPAESPDPPPVHAPATSARARAEATRRGRDVTTSVWQGLGGATSRWRR